ncbi:single-stranded-DNA-specific exonuclease RecJ [Plectonema cf. radiosum LEGE 06105]|uniref:Single-stranded-DNA-specific exonuclease RecJ n=2 Tax=Plectonema TaxID=1183 RepID=A0A8J7F6C6_9CYAN|nr:single-stranded-DNA-specific exonuclease RecJ [Plectonema radiosum]MBE9212739.1 single-stranded-DNA-specific exonuclease RecJ [Plectonema cf. radiosum LEGE 06105]
MSEQQWILKSTEEPPKWFLELVQTYISTSKGNFAAQLLWQRGIRDKIQLENHINPQTYQSASPFEFGQEMHLAVERLQQARNNHEKVTIWGDFDADGITSTAVLWDGLGQFFAKNTQLNYYIPNRLTESHGLNIHGIEKLKQQGCQLIITCDTGSTNIDEIIYANNLDIDIIVTDHHTLLPERPPVTAIINPRNLPESHQLFHLSGVAVAYKLVEALYISLPQIPQQPLEDLLDLVAVGLIADLVQLSGDCRYLAQLGIGQLQQDFKKPPVARRRPGVGRLLELCQKNGDRPTDISFGLGPRINAVSRIQGDASFCVELLTSREHQRVCELAEITELANTRRKSLQKDVGSQVAQKLSQIDLSTTSVIVLADPQWAVGVLGLVAGQVAQDTGRPTILLSTEEVVEDDKENINFTPSPPSLTLARGSARSVNSVDLYQLVKDQAHLLHRFGGHPFAAGLSIPVENIALFTQAINQRLRQISGGITPKPTVEADLIVTVADLGKELFLELKLLEPCGMGNPVPKLLIKNCWFENTWHRNQEDSRGQKIQYIKTEFNIRDDSTTNTFSGIWWGHYKDELPPQKCDCIVELDYNTFKKRYEIRLITVRPAKNAINPVDNSLSFILDWRNMPPNNYPSLCDSPLMVKECPTRWDDLRVWLRRSFHKQQPLALAWSKTNPQPPEEIWFKLVGIAKYLCRTNQAVTRIKILEKLSMSNQTLHLGFQALKNLGYTIKAEDNYLIFSHKDEKNSTDKTTDAIEKFIAAIREEEFQKHYFNKVPISIINYQLIGNRVGGNTANSGSSNS